MILKICGEFNNNVKQKKRLNPRRKNLLKGDNAIPIPDETKNIPYKVRKGNRPTIEEIIAYCLDGELKNAALNFAAFMSENAIRKKDVPAGER